MSSFARSSCLDGPGSLGLVAFLVGNHDPPDVIGKPPFQTPPGLPRLLALRDLGLVIDVARAPLRPDLGDGDNVQRGVELPISGPGQSVPGAVGTGHLEWSDA